MLPVDDSDACSYTQRSHYTNEANAYHMKKCVAEWMSRMTNTEQCVEYMGGIGHKNAGMQSCSVNDLIDICTSKRHTFTVEDATELCTELNKGHARFWGKHHDSADHSTQKDEHDAYLSRIGRADE